MVGPWVELRTPQQPCVRPDCIEPATWLRGYGVGEATITDFEYACDLHKDIIGDSDAKDTERPEEHQGTGEVAS